MAEPLRNAPKRRPTTSDDDRENELVHLAELLAEQQLRDGTAAPSVIVHYLKLGSTRERIEKEILTKQSDLLTAKTEAIQSAKRVEELYSKAISAFQDYSGNSQEDIDDIPEDSVFD